MSTTGLSYLRCATQVACLCDCVTLQCRVIMVNGAATRLLHSLKESCQCLSNHNVELLGSSQWIGQEVGDSQYQASRWA
jgi:hypothetical protein